MEVVGCLHLAIKRNLITPAEFSMVREKCKEILLMINGLRNSLS
ncbi:hypothetical protein ABTH29_19710 [Acinetobacter baumannii]